MSNLIRNKVQYMSDAFIKFHEQCLYAVQDFIVSTDNDEQLYFVVEKSNDFYKVKLTTRSNIPVGDYLIFQTPQNFKWNMHYTLLAAWGAEKLTKWYNQVRG